MPITFNGLNFIFQKVYFISDFIYSEVNMNYLSKLNTMQFKYDERNEADK